MGYSGGSSVMENFIRKMKKSPRFKKDPDAREEVYRILYEELLDQDWDTEDEPLGQDPAYDKIFHEKHPTYAQDNE